VKRHALELLRADAEGFGIPMGFVHPILGPWKNIRKNSFLIIKNSPQITLVV
jgi:hypothetical protein